MYGCGDVCVVCVCSLVLACVRRCPTFPEGSLKFYLIRIWVRRCERGCLRVREYEGECLGFDTTQRPLARGLQKRKKGMNRRLVAISFPRTMHHSLQSCVQTMRHNGTSTTLVCVCVSVLQVRCTAVRHSWGYGGTAKPPGVKADFGTRCLPGIKYLWRLIQQYGLGYIMIKIF